MAVLLLHRLARRDERIVVRLVERLCCLGLERLLRRAVGVDELAIEARDNDPRLATELLLQFRRKRLGQAVSVLIADRGGPEELSTLEQAYCRRLGETEAVVRLLASDLATRGLFTPRGRVRNTFQRWTEAVSQWDPLAQRIGVGRQARLLSLQDYLAQGATAVSAERER